MSRTLNIIGAGNVACVLGRIWQETGQVRLKGIVNRSLRTAAEAAEFMGGGQAMNQVEELPPAQLWMVGVNDDAIESIVDTLVRARNVAGGSVVFHLSGALASRVFAPLEEANVKAGSLHPLKSFPDALQAYQQFDDTHCVIEGEPGAVAVLTELCEAIGCTTSRLNANQKLLYHIANTMVSNDLVALLDVGLTCYQLAGIPEQTARQMVGPLMVETLGNALRDGTAKALTGPIARGDVHLLEQHLNNLPAFANDIYRSLGVAALDIVRRERRLDSDLVNQIKELLRH